MISSSPVLFKILGPLEVLIHGTPLSLGGTKQRSVLAMLLAEPNRVVAIHRLIDCLWDEGQDENLKGTLQVHVSNIRKVLAPATIALGRKELIVTQAPGYRITVNESELDLLAFNSHISSARRSFVAGDFIRASFRYGEALALWRGIPLADLSDEPFVHPVAARLERFRMDAVEGRIESELSLGRHKEALGELFGLANANPLDERFAGLLMIALYRSGRQAEALDTYQSSWKRLQDLGLDPGQSLRDLERRILSQDPSLNPPVKGQPDLALPTILRSSLTLPRARLFVNGTSLELTQPVTTIGRQSDSHVVIEDPRASRSHAEIRRDIGGFKIIDKGSSNGTIVNGSRVQEHLLEPNDEILIGGTKMQFLTASGGSGID